MRPNKKASIAAIVISVVASSVAWAGYGNEDECRNARERASSSALDLSIYARKLQRCAEAGDLTDDCSMEFRRVKNAHSDYESAVMDVGSECD
jgi:hypothetical protein